MSYKNEFQANNIDLQTILDMINELPEASSGNDGENSDDISSWPWFAITPLNWAYVFQISYPTEGMTFGEFLNTQVAKQFNMTTGTTLETGETGIVVGRAGGYELFLKHPDNNNYITPNDIINNTMYYNATYWVP